MLWYVLYVCQCTTIVALDSGTTRDSRINYIQMSCSSQMDAEPVSGSFGELSSLYFLICSTLTTMSTGNQTLPPHSLSFMTLGCAEYLAKILHTLNGRRSSRPLRQIPSTPTYGYCSLNNNHTRLQSPQIQLPSPHPRIVLVLEA